MIPALGNHLWQSTLFAAAAAVLALALRQNRAQVRYCLWLVASLKFLIPFSLLTAIGSQLTSFTPAPNVHPVFSTAVQEVSKPFIAPPLAISETAGPSTTSFMPWIVFTLWLCGFVAVLFRWLRSWLRVRASVRTATPIGLRPPVRILSSPTLLEPGIFGIFRPVLLLPEGITRQLAPAHLETILAHELCHVRRRDNLAAALHMLVEGLFWFHPLVWWIGARLVEERERACDEEVIRQGNQPDVYAESILKTCQFYVESPLACVSGVTGSDLKKRIVRIMAQTITARLDFRKKLLLGCAAALAVALPLAVGLTNASQAANPEPSFEVASIKPTKPGTEGMMVHVQPGGRLAANNVPLELLLEHAYHVTKYQIVGAPPWVTSDHFDITAKPGDAAGAAIDKLPRDQRLDAMIQMVRSLLADRFRLVLGHETKELPVYALVVAKNGPKFHRSIYQSEAKSTVGTVPEKPPQGVYFTGRGKLTVSNGDMPSFANVISGEAVDRIVVDRTGLTGKYDFTLNWTPDPNEGPRMPGGPPPQAPDAAPPPSESSGPSLFTALQEQLGLKLESQKAPVDVLVIQHVEKPSEN